ncbi:MAG: glycosyltransferase family 4 protein [Bacteroidales bacterium]|nr:glycosyltransferase family 4 protein [Bacteroidales bacterium]
MRLLLIVDDYLPHSTKIASKMMHELALEFKRQGHDVSVLTPFSNQNISLVQKNLDGIEILYFKSGSIKNISKIKRAFNETILGLIAWVFAGKILRNQSFDGIIYYSPSIFFGKLVGKLKKHWNCNSYLILRDIFPQWAADNGLIHRNSPIYYFFKIFEWINYNNADKIGVMLPSNQELFSNTKFINKVEVLFNWSEIPEIHESDGFFRKKLNLEDKIVMFYGGNIGHAQKMMNLVELAHRFIEDSRVHFLFVGEGDETELIKKEKVQRNISNLTLLPSVDQQTYFEMLNEFDIGLFSLHPDHKTNNFPGKLLGYMGYSKPILGCVNEGNDLKEIINSSKSGFVSDCKESENLYNAAKLLVDSAELRREMGENGRKLLAKKFSVRSTSIQIENALKKD